MDTTNSIAEVNKLIAEHGSNLAIVVNHSGGKDSQRMLGFIRENFPGRASWNVSIVCDTSMHQ